MNDDDLIARVRAAVQNEAGPGDDALAERLLHGTARARRARRAGALTLAVVVLAGAGVAGKSLVAGDGDSTLRIQSADNPPPAGHPETAGAVTVEQAARQGLDGAAECNALAATNAGDDTGGDITTPLRLTGAYLTDTDGLEAWTREYSGAFTTWTVPPPIETIAMCWYSGDVPADLSVGPATAEFDYQLVAVHVGDPNDGSALRLDMRSATPFPVMAPPVPAGTPAKAPLRTFPQPDGVPVVDELPPGLVPLPPEPGATQGGLPPLPPGPDREQEATGPD